MDDQPPIPEPHPTSPTAVRKDFHQLIELLSDEEATAFWYLIASWLAARSRWSSEDQS